MESNGLKSAGMDGNQTWEQVDEHISRLFSLVDPALASALERCEAEGLPSIQVSESQGHFLRLLVRAVGAERVLEVGTLGGFSTILLARGFREDGIVVSLELDPHHAAVARSNVAAAALEKRVQVLEGDAHASLARMIEEGEKPFDLVFLDAEKPGYPAYLDAVLALSRSGTVIIADNVVRQGAILEKDTQDANALGAQEFHARVASSSRLSATVIQTVGSKGHDGFLFAVVE